MFYRIRVNLAFDLENSADDILDKAKDYIDQAVTINPNSLITERGYIVLEKCFHDENPAKPCEVIEELFTD